MRLIHQNGDVNFYGTIRDGEYVSKIGEQFKLCISQSKSEGNRIVTWGFKNSITSPREHAEAEIEIRKCAERYLPGVVEKSTY